ncbi:MAG: hypothetical protein WKG00_30380 [Polyangiaceae bacterium]
MKSLRRSTIVALAVLVTAPMSLLGSMGCSGTQGSKAAKVQAGDMPDGADWSGVYYSELYGYLHIVQDGNAVSGKWLRPVKDRWGELHGQATGDLIKFSWTEHTIGSVGPKANRSGKGYFKYKRPAGDNVDDTILGQIGVGADETGEPWDAVKQRNVNPDLGSIGGTGAMDVGGGDWDNENKEKGTPEPPVAPEAPKP